MKIEHVNIAGKYTEPINMQRHDTALDRVPAEQGTQEFRFVQIKKIKPIGVQPVYNMEVKDHHNFLVNGGLVVHNCIDATRYAMNDVMRSGGMRILR